jgi:anhydro-N-acetylmuramic acid kinase
MNKNELFIGVMSGTSLDGVDIALCEINASACSLLHYCESSIPQELKQEILNAISSSLTLQDVGTLEHKLGLLYAESINTFLEKFDINPQDINAIGLHGQTLWHQPQGDTPFSMQLGDANIVCAITGIKTVSDFRRMDIANGGQGAPFAPAFHKFLFERLGKGVAVLNIGGMANITILGEELLGWDSGCGNVLLDYWIGESSDKPYDLDGAYAKSGELNSSLLKAMLEDEYFKKPAPKSTGREYFNHTWLDNMLAKFEPLQAADIQRTLLELTALSITNDLKTRDIKTLIVCGGGAKNKFLMQRLQELNSADVKPSCELDINGDALEAMAFAWFAYKRIHNEKVDLKSVTGATKNSLLGAIYG